MWALPQVPVPWRNIHLLHHGALHFPGRVVDFLVLSPTQAAGKYLLWHLEHLILLLLLWQKNLQVFALLLLTYFPLSLPMWHFFCFLKIHFPRCAPTVAEGLSCATYTYKSNAPFEYHILCILDYFLLAGNSNFFHDHRLNTIRTHTTTKNPTISYRLHHF